MLKPISDDLEEKIKQNFNDGEDRLILDLIEDLYQKTGISTDYFAELILSYDKKKYYTERDNCTGQMCLDTEVLEKLIINSMKKDNNPEIKAKGYLLDNGWGGLDGFDINQNKLLIKFGRNRLNEIIKTIKYFSNVLGIHQETLMSYSLDIESNYKYGYFDYYLLDRLKKSNNLDVSAKATLYENLLQGRPSLETRLDVDIASLVLFNVGNEYYFIPTKLISKMSEYFGGVSTELFTREDINYIGFYFECKDKVIKVVTDVLIQTYPMKRNNIPYSSLPLVA